MEVHCSEGLANHIGPESCAGAREGVCEALTGERIGQPLSLVKPLVPSADVLRKAEGNTTQALSQVWCRLGGVREPGMCASSLSGNREISGLTSCGTGLVRIGKARSRSR